MKKVAHQVSRKYNVDYKQLIGRGKSHDIQAARRELVYELITQDFAVEDIAKFLGNRALSIVRRLYISYASRKDNKRRERK